MLRALFILLILLTMLPACSGKLPKMTREEWLQVTHRYYGGVSKEEALAATEKLLYLADGDDFEFVHTDEGLSATRRWSEFYVISASSGTDFWRVKAIEDDNGVDIGVEVSCTKTNMTPMATTGGNWTATSMPSNSRPVRGTSLYDLFFSRLDYLLGKSDQWMTCEQADARIDSGETWGNSVPLCSSLSAKDNHP